MIASNQQQSKAKQPCHVLQRMSFSSYFIDYRIWKLEKCQSSINLLYDRVEPIAKQSKAKQPCHVLQFVVENVIQQLFYRLQDLEIEEMSELYKLALRPRRTNSKAKQSNRVVSCRECHSSVILQIIGFGNWRNVRAL